MTYKIDNVPLGMYWATPVLSGERIALAGIFDCPKRKSPTERNWETSIEPFVDEADILLDGRELSMSVIIDKKKSLDNLKSAIIDCTQLSADSLSFYVICKSAIDVTEHGDFYKLSFKFWEEYVEIQQLSTTGNASANSLFRIDSFDLMSDFGIHVTKVISEKSTGARLEVNTTEQYDQTEFRDLNEVTIDCAMKGTSILNLYQKIKLLQSLLLSPGMRVLVIGNTPYSAYFKAGFKATMIADYLLKFSIKLNVV